MVTMENLEKAAVCMFQYGVIQQGDICYSQLTPQLRLDFCICIVQCFQEVHFFSSPDFDRCACYICTLFYGLAALLTPKTPHDCEQYVSLARRMSNRPSAEKNYFFCGKQLASSSSQKVHLSHIQRLPSQPAAQI